jgi:hypothetical protein
MAFTDPRHHEPLSEADIQAYADGTLAPERAARLHRYLETRPGEARRIAFYGRLNAQIQRAFRQTDEPSAARPFNGPGRQSALRRLRSTLRRSVALRFALTLILALLAGSGWIAASQVSAQALNNAAIMALAETAEKRFPMPAAGPIAGAREAAPDLTMAGLRLAAHKTQTLDRFARANEFVYLNADGQPIILLTARTLSVPARPQWAARRIGDIRLLTWTTRWQRYVLAGDAQTHGLMRAADAMTLR